MNIDIGGRIIVMTINNKGSIKKITLLLSLLFAVQALLFPSCTAATAPLPSVVQQELAPGVTYTILHNRQNLAGEALSVYVLEVDINKQDLEILPVTGGSRFGDTETVQSLAKRHNAVAAVNGGFFYQSADRRLPLGNLIIEGKPLSISDYWRSSFAISHPAEESSPLQLIFGHFQPRAELIFPGSSVTATSINSRSSQPGVHLHTPEWAEEKVGMTGSLNATFVWAGLNSYRLSGISNEPQAIPPAGLVLRFHGDTARAVADNLAAGSILTMEHHYDKTHWGHIQHLMTAGPMLVVDGKPVFAAIQEGFTGTALQPNSRTALGVNSAGRVMLVVAERTARGSRVGLTLEETALLMAELGAVNAIGLDGGGSSTLYASGKVSGHAALSPRPVANALLVLQGPRLYLNNSRVYPDVPPVIDTGRTLVPVRVIMEEMQARVEWDGESRTVTIKGQENDITLVIDSPEAIVDGTPFLLDVPPQVINGRTMIPVRFVTEALKGTVHWDAVQRAIYLTV